MTSNNKAAHKVALQRLLSVSVRLQQLQHIQRVAPDPLLPPDSTTSTLTQKDSRHASQKSS